MGESLKNSRRVYLPVVVLDDVAHRPDGCQVFIKAVRVDVVQGLGGLGVSVRAGEVDGNLNHDRRVKYLLKPMLL